MKDQNKCKKLVGRIMLVALIIAVESQCQPTLTDAIGARSKAMGGTGYALSDDGSALFYNPAGLGIQNYRWDGGEIQYFRETLFHERTWTFYSLIFQNEKLKGLGLSSYLNHLGIVNNVVDVNNNIVGTWHHNQFVIGTGAGYCFYKGATFSNAFGISTKYYGEGVLLFFSFQTSPFKLHNSP